MNCNCEGTEPVTEEGFKEPKITLEEADTQTFIGVRQPEFDSELTVSVSGKAQAKYLSSEVAGGFTGVVMGLYAVDEQENWAEFRDFYWKQGQ